MKLLEFFVKDYLTHNNFLGEDFFFNEHFTHTMDEAEISFLKEQLIAAKAGLDSYYESYEINDIEFSHSRLRLYKKQMQVYDRHNTNKEYSIEDLFACNTNFPSGRVDAVLEMTFTGVKRWKYSHIGGTVGHAPEIGTRHRQSSRLNIILKDWRAV